MTSKKFNPQQMQHCLDVLDALAQSALSTQDFAQTQGLSYCQLQAGQSHAPRWRAQLSDATDVAPARRKPTSQTRFIQLKVADAQKPVTPADLSTQTISPSEAPVQCAQWLKAYLA